MRSATGASVGDLPASRSPSPRFRPDLTRASFRRVKPTAFPLVRRTPAHRLTALLAVVLFLFTWTGEALGMHACPHHDAVLGADRMAQGAAGHVGHHAARPDRDAPAPDHAGHHACTCQGTCPSATGGALPAAGEAVVRVAPPAVLAAAAADAGSIVPRLVPFFLPYGQGPPLLG